MNAGAKKKENYSSRYGDMPHVMVVDDDVRICELVSRYLGEHGFVVLSANDGRQARALLERFEFDALVVDVMMPGETGLEFTHALREDQVDVPVLLLTALGEVDDRIVGLEAGADDYLSKPFEPRELVLRLNAILRRTVKVQDAGDQAYKIGDWRFDPQRDVLERDVSGDGSESVKLTTMESNLIKALGARSGEVLSRDELAELCGAEAGERTIDVQVTRLRRKIEEDTKAPRYLQTVRGKGYLLRAEKI